MDEPTGFSGDKETRRLDMLLFKDVVLPQMRQKPKQVVLSTLCYLLVIWGAVSSTGFLTHTPVGQHTAALVSSPLPLVFSSYNGVETFATRFDLDVSLHNGIEYTIALDLPLYSKLGGSYNRRNTYGAAFAFGPLFEDPKLIRLRDEVLQYAICAPGNVAKEFGITQKVDHIDILMRVKTRDDNRLWVTRVDCTKGR